MFERISTDRYLGVLVALLSITTAFAAYQVAIADARAGELEVEAIKTLTESNTEFLRSNQDVMLDYAAYDNYVIDGERDEEIADYYRGGFSLALEASLDRTDGPFDDAYFDESFREADLLYEEALDLFDAGAAAGAAVDRLQLVMLVLAVGLSLAAYASLGDRRGKLAQTFVGIATVTLLFGLMRLGLILL